jgi:DNA end-binding protein Ku
MAARSLWNGAIRFGLVNVPIKVYGAASSKQIRFRELHVTDAAPLEHRRVCAKEDKEVPFDEVVRGYETSPGRYVVLSKDEIQAPARERGKTIDLEDFVPGEQIDPVFYDTPYWLGPQQGGEDAYAVLMAALERTAWSASAASLSGRASSWSRCTPVDGRSGSRRCVSTTRSSTTTSSTCRSRRRGQRQGGQDGRCAGRLAAHRVRPDGLRRHLPRARARDRRGEGEGKQIVAPDTAPEEETTDLMALLEQSVSGARKTKKPKAKARKAKAKS